MGMIETDASGGRKSAGRIMLCIILQTKTEGEVAKIVGCSRSFIGHCATGKRVPYGYPVRQAFWEKLRIPLTAW